MHAQPTVRRIVGFGLATLAVGILGAASFMPQATIEDELKPDTVRITITANAVTLSPDTVRAGDVTLMVTNSSPKSQDFDLDGPGPNGEPDAELDDIAPGETRTATIRLGAGTYGVEAEEDEGNNERRAILTVR